MDFIECSKHFIVIADKSGISRASRHLDLPVSKLSKQLNWLEDHLQQKLFFRTTRQFQLTEAGKFFYTEISKVLITLKTIKKSLKDYSQQAKGLIRFAMPVILKRTKIMGYLLTSLASHPELELKIINENAVNSILDDKADMGLSTQLVNNQQLIRVTVSNSTRKIFAAPSYILQHGKPKTIDELEHHNCLYNTIVQKQGRWKFMNNKCVTVSGNYSCETIANLISAGVKGIGLIYVAENIIQDEIKNGELIQIDIPNAVDQRHIYLYHKKMPRQSAQHALLTELLTSIKQYGLA